MLARQKDKTLLGNCKKVAPGKKGTDVLKNHIDGGGF